ncbi:MAG: hypothetical protein NT011_13470 [Kiritimatiellaeota bacterium]|nr:hypothetical protein [Kiritimatiellota bacterium]
MTAPTLTTKRIRLLINADKWANALDVLASATPRMWRGNDCQFELGIHWNSQLIDASNLAVLSLSIYTVNRQTRKATKTISAAEITANPTAAGWSDTTQQHAVLAFTAEEMNWALSSNLTEETFWLVVDGITDAGKDITYGYSVFTLVEDGTGVVGAPPANDPLYYTQPEADARFIPLLGDGYTFCVKKATDGNFYLCFYTQEDGHWHAVVSHIVEGKFTFSEGPPVD